MRTTSLDHFSLCLLLTLTPPEPAPPLSPPSYSSTSSLLSPPLISSPSPVLGPLHPYSSHLILPVHSHWPSPIGDLDPLHHLAVKGVLVAAGHSHRVLDVLSPLVVVDGVEPEDTFVLVPCLQVVQVLFLSGEAKIIGFTHIMNEHEPPTVQEHLGI